MPVLLNKLAHQPWGIVAYNLDAEPEIMTWLAGRRIDAIAFNDHMSGTVDASSRAQQLAQMVARAGVTRERFLAVVSQPPRTPPRTATISCSAPPTSFAVAATPDGSTPPR